MGQELVRRQTLRSLSLLLALPQKVPPRAVQRETGLRPWTPLELSGLRIGQSLDNIIAECSDSIATSYFHPFLFGGGFP